MIYLIQNYRLYGLIECASHKIVQQKKGAFLLTPG